MSQRLEQLELILGVPHYSQSRDSKGETTYYFQGGILYENLQLLLKLISKGLDYKVVFEQSVYKYTQDGILQRPRTIVVAGRHYVRDGLYVTWLDHDFYIKHKEQELKDYYKDVYV